MKVSALFHQPNPAMSLKPTHIEPVPELTRLVAQQAFPKGSVFMRLRDEFGTLYTDADFQDLFPKRGQPALPPWRLALVTIMQFIENLSDRQAAQAVRARIDWKYALGLELTDAGFDFSVLSEFRGRLLQGGAEQRLLDKMLLHFKDRGLLKAGGLQRTDSTHVLAAVRLMNRLELVGETLRAALSQLATVAPEWTRQAAAPEWFERYSRRVEQYRLPKAKIEREAYALTVGRDGLALLRALTKAPAWLQQLSMVQTLGQVWKRQYDIEAESLRWKTTKELPRAANNIESPYDTEARFSSKKDKTAWLGYKVHLTETCQHCQLHVITQVKTTAATEADVACTDAIERDLVARDLAPDQHLVDTGYIDAELLVESQNKYNITLVGPPRGNPSWQAKTPGAYTRAVFEIDWDGKQMRCPQGHVSSTWTPQIDRFGMASFSVKFAKKDCDACTVRARCTRAKQSARQFKLYPRAQFEALEQAREWMQTEAGKKLYHRRAGIEGTISQGVRAFGLRRSRYRGQAKTHLQHIATAAGMNLLRVINWLDGHEQELTRTSRFAALRP